MTEVARRLHIGGLYEGITNQQLEDRFKSFGRVTDVEVKVKKDESGQTKLCAYNF